jgi:hypothetical protein
MHRDAEVDSMLDSAVVDDGTAKFDSAAKRRRPGTAAAARSNP